LRDHSLNPDIDTRIIVRGDLDPRVKELLQESYYNMKRIRLQNRCHTKGIIIHDLAVVVGSHNWSGEGTLENRDASLIIHDLDAIAYYEKLFSYDWARATSEDIEASNRCACSRRLACSPQRACGGFRGETSSSRIRRPSLPQHFSR